MLQTNALPTELSSQTLLVIIGQVGNQGEKKPLLLSPAATPLFFEWRQLGILLFQCPEPDLNWYAPFGTRDFKSPVSADSTIRACLCSYSNTSFSDCLTIVPVYLSLLADNLSAIWNILCLNLRLGQMTN